MRCLACNKRLNSRESTRKYSSSGNYIDLCDHCFSFVSEEIPDTEDGISGDPDFDGVDFEDTEGLDELGLSTNNGGEGNEYGA